MYNRVYIYIVSEHCLSAEPRIIVVHYIMYYYYCGVYIYYMDPRHATTIAAYCKCKEVEKILLGKQCFYFFAIASTYYLYLLYN